MVIAKIRGGLGNQMFQYATGRALAARLGKKLALDLSFYETNKSRPFELGRFKIKASVLSKKQTAWEKKKQAFARTLPGTILGKLPGGCIHEAFAEDRRENFTEEYMRIMDDVWLEGFWQNERYFSKIRDVLLDEFTFQEAPGVQNTEILSHIDSVNSVCVHVRRGDYVTTPEGREGLGACSMDYYQRALGAMQKQVENPEFFLFTDDPEWAQNNFHANGLEIISHNTGKNDWEDLRLMMHCRHFIIANSSFSWWGAWLSRFSGKKVIAPEVWFKSPAHTHRHPALDSWLRL